MSTALDIGGIIAGTLGGALSGDDDESLEVAKLSSRDRRAQILIELIKDEAERQMHNRRMEANVPVARELTQRMLDPTSVPFSPITARAMPQTHVAAGGQGVSMTPGGQPATPEQLAMLTPNLDQFIAIRENARAATAGMVPGNYQRDSILPQLNSFDLTRGQFLSSDNGPNEHGEEALVQQMAQSSGPQQMPSGRAPHRPSVAQEQGEQNDPRLQQARQIAEQKLNEINMRARSGRSGF